MVNKSERAMLKGHTDITGTLKLGLLKREKNKTFCHQNNAIWVKVTFWANGASLSDHNSLHNNGTVSSGS